MSLKTSDQTNYWPSFIEYSSSILGLVIDDSGIILRGNQNSEKRIEREDGSSECVVVIFSEDRRRILPSDIINSRSGEQPALTKARIWIQCHNYCIDFGAQWEISVRTHAGIQYLTAIGFERELDHSHQACGCSKLTHEKVKLHTTYEKLAERIPGFLFEFERSDDGCFQSFPFMSNGLSKLLGITPEELRHDAALLLELIAIEDRESFEQSIQKSANNHSFWRHTFRFNCPHKGTKWVQGFGAPERVGKKVVWRGFVYDITSKMNFEERLRKQQAELDEIAFLQAHEFRRPLANMLSLFDMIELQSREVEAMDNIVELLNMLKKSVKEADEVIAKIVTKTNNSKWLMVKHQT